MNSVNDNSYILKDNIYIYQNNIIKCTKSGIMKMPEIENGYTAYYQNGNIKIIPSETSPVANELQVSNEIFYLPDNTAYYLNSSIVINLIEPYSSSYNSNDENIAFVDESYNNKYMDILLNYPEVEKGEYRVVDKYIFGKYYPKFTELYDSN